MLARPTLSGPNFTSYVRRSPTVSAFEGGTAADCPLATRGPAAVARMATTMAIVDTQLRWWQTLAGRACVACVARGISEKYRWELDRSSQHGTRRCRV